MKIQWLVSLPVVGTMIAIANSYVSGGSFDSDSKMAPLSSWGRVIGIPALISTLLSCWMIYPGIRAHIDGKDVISALGPGLSDPGTLLVSVLPNILGFGIGVYALVFSISSRIVKDFDTQIKKQKSNRSALVLNADMAFPLVVLLIAICYGLVLRKFPAGILPIAFGWMILWYSLLLTLGLIGTLFRLGEHELLDKM